MEILKINNLIKSFGQLKVIQDLNMTVQENTVFGFIGKNGAGKTTTMKMVMGFTKPDSGEIVVCGERVQFGNTQTNRYIGFLPDVPEFYDYMTPKEYLTLCGEVTGFNIKKTKEKIGELLTIVGLDGINRRIKGFSRGMKQRLGIAQALLNNPKLLICDEPTSALDPVGRKEILDILKSIKQETTIVFSTHILSDVERICDVVGILNNGQIVLEGDLASVKGTYRNDRILLELQDPCQYPAVTEKLRVMPEIKAVQAVGNSLQVSATNAEKAAKSILKLLSEEEFSLCRFEILEPDLEQVFMEVIAK